jgi:ribosomal protein S18 acetylase RimI-like enzyme
MTIRSAAPADDDAIWAILEPIVRAGETYALPRDWSRSEVIAFWRGSGHDVFVAEHDGAIVGTYFVCPNRLGGGAHVANAGYATAAAAQGKGVARAMCEHSIDHARGRGFRAMQFNFVIASNTRAVALWQRMGFSIVGTLPDAFAHPALGDVDALVMYRRL